MTKNSDGTQTLEENEAAVDEDMPIEVNQVDPSKVPTEKKRLSDNKDELAKENTTNMIVEPESTPIIQEVIIETEIEPFSIREGGHESFDKMCKNYIGKTGIVNYTDWKKDEGLLDTYLTYLSDNSPKDIWSKNRELAYWINVYNAFTIKLILKNHPLKSIRDLNGGEPWKEIWINLGGKSYSLNNIEHDIIRPKFNDPRIHFAVNCAAKSCPPIQNFAFTEDNVQTKLDEVAGYFINNSGLNQITERAIKVSKIFEWYSSDFGNIIAFLNKYCQTQISSKAKVEYLDYDWSLNGK